MVAGAVLVSALYLIHRWRRGRTGNVRAVCEACVMRRSCSGRDAGKMLVDAPAKINLRLEITGKRDDGHHELETVFLPVHGLADRLSIRCGAEPGIRLQANGDVPSDSSNLACRAAAEFAERAGIAPEWDIELEKNIPIAAGLGGGSSDAAAVLLALNGRYGALDEREMLNLALSIGADVPFFLNPQPSLAKGIGEILSPLECVRPVPLLLVNPRFPVSAAWAYRHWSPGGVRKGDTKALVSALAAGDVSAIIDNVWNDLARAVMDKFPILTILDARLRDAGALTVELSGSGPTLFAVCADMAAAEKMALELGDEFGAALDCFAVEAGGSSA